MIACAIQRGGRPEVSGVMAQVEQLLDESVAANGPGPDLTPDEEAHVKRIAEEVLKREKLALDWRKKQRTRAAVHIAVEETLDRLPEKYTPQMYAQKCGAVYHYVFEAYFDDGHSV